MNRQCFQCNEIKEATEFRSSHYVICNKCDVRKDKRCTVCKKVKSKKLFTRNGSVILSYCKQCAAIKNKQWRDKNPDKWKAIYMKNNQRKRVVL